MKITKVSYSGLFNLGNYNNEKIGLTAHLDEGEDPEIVVEALREQAVAMAANKGLGNETDIRYEIRRRVDDLEDLRIKCVKAQNEWNQVAEFLRAQGIKPDAPNLSLKTLMPSIQEESTAVNGELIDAADDEF
ncbi:MAG: hypothetical protein AAF609_12540 [Cyanobacteria bacterium P01_C01_bin.120]